MPIAHQRQTLGRPHLTVPELAERWSCTPKTIRRNFRTWGLRPLNITGAHLFPLTQVESLEERVIRGEVNFPVRGGRRRITNITAEGV
jgi:hypothetical protein